MAEPQKPPLTVFKHMWVAFDNKDDRSNSGLIISRGEKAEDSILLVFPTAEDVARFAAQALTCAYRVRIETSSVAEATAPASQAPPSGQK